MKIALPFLLISVFILSGCQNQTNKYDECIQTCKDNKTCIERGEGSDHGPASERVGDCKKWSDGECKNICIEKYK